MEPYVVRSHICEKAQQKIAEKAVEYIKGIQRPKNRENEYLAISKYNSFVMGEQNYYCMATMVNVDFRKIAFRINKVLKNRLGTRLKRIAGIPLKNAVTERYGRSGQLRYVSDHPIAPLGYVQNRHPKGKARAVNKYTPTGRSIIHDTLQINTAIMLALMRQPAYGRSVEFMDNRIALFCAQYGKCAVTGQIFRTVDDIHCHHKIPKFLDGTDCYQNLALVRNDVHILIHATGKDVTSTYLNACNLTAEQLKALN